MLSAILGCVLSGSVAANIVTTENLIDNSTGVVLPVMTFSLEDTEESRQALNVGVLGGLGLGMLLMARRKR